MGKREYPSCIRELYESEIFGETFMLALMEAAISDQDRYHFGTFLQLATKTKARLRPFLSKYNISLSEVMDLPDTDELIAGYRQAAWEGFMAANIPVQSFLARFIEIAKAGPAEDEDILDSMVRHESAILRWLDLESDGSSAESSLDGIIEQLQYPLPKPSTVA